MPNLNTLFFENVLNALARRTKDGFVALSDVPDVPDAKNPVYYDPERENEVVWRFSGNEVTYVGDLFKDERVICLVTKSSRDGKQEIQLALLTEEKTNIAMFRIRDGQWDMPQPPLRSWMAGAERVRSCAPKDLTAEFEGGAS